MRGNFNAGNGGKQDSLPKQNRPLVRDGRLQTPKKRTDRSYLRPGGPEVADELTTVDEVESATDETIVADVADATEEAVVEAKALGLKVGAWTVNEPEDMRRLIALGLDGICTDRPDLLAKELKRKL